MEKSGAKAYLVNTGWNGTGKRISIKDTRGIIDAILNGDILKAPTKKIPYFNIEVPTELPGVDTNILDPRDTYADASEWETKAKDLAQRFIKNFAKYENNEAGKALVSAVLRSTDLLIFELTSAALALGLSSAFYYFRQVMIYDGTLLFYCL